MNRLYRDLITLLERSEKYILSFIAVDDSATQLARSNMLYGLAKMHWVQEALGYPVDALFIGAPDMTTPRYLTKWRWGLAMGGILSWGDGTRPLVFLDLQVSTSTALVGGLDREPDLSVVIERAARLQQSRPVVMGVEVDWDFDRGNHFINAYRIVPITQGNLPPYVFVLHGGDRESALGIRAGLREKRAPPGTNGGY